MEFAFFIYMKVFAIQIRAFMFCCGHAGMKNQGSPWLSVRQTFKIKGILINT